LKVTYLANGQGGRCDGCGAKFGAEGAQLWGCRKCDYDLCHQCFQQQQQQYAPSSKGGSEPQVPGPTLLSSSNDKNDKPIVPGQSAIIRNCPNAKLNGQQVVCEEYNTALGEWQVKGQGFPLSIGMSMPTKYLEVISSNSNDKPIVRPVQAGDAAGDGSLVIRFDDLLKTTLESALQTFTLEYPTKLSVGDVVNTVKERADAIHNEGVGKGPSGKCPFSSAYEVHIFYTFCLSVLGVWSGHDLGEDEDVDAAFYSQLARICEILKNLDTSAVFLPEEIDQNIHGLKREALWPNWFDGEMKKGEAAAQRCIAIGKEWKLEETERYQSALAKLEGNVQSNVQN